MPIQKYISGTYRNNYKGKEYEYKSFSPSLINKPFEWKDRKINLLMEQAVRFLGELNAYSMLIPDVNFFIQMHLIKEATTSSRIEGTKTEVEEVLLPLEEIIPEKRDDWEEVQNYIKAINYAISQLEKIPLCMRLIKDTHRILLSGVRGQEKQPGEIRTSQNWIGGSNLNNAIYIPPHPDELPELLTDLENFWHNDELDIPLLLKIAMTHYQFETIHPFLDGNGRIGRLLIVLQLIDYQFLGKPVLYISQFFEKNRAIYFHRLQQVRLTNDMESWLKFFLSGVIETSIDSKTTLEKIIDLRKEYEYIIRGFGRQSKLAHKLLLFLFSNPIISVKEVNNELNISFATANILIQKFLNIGILKEITGYSRNRLFMLWKYVDLFKE